MLKFHIDLAEEAAKILRANFLEANLKAVIYSAGLTLPLSDFLTFFLHLAPPFSATLHPPVRPRLVPPLSIPAAKNISATAH